MMQEEHHEAGESPQSTVPLTVPPTAAQPAEVTIPVSSPEPEAVSPATLEVGRHESETPNEEPDGSGLATVQQGLWGLWQTVSNVGVVKAAVSTARNVTDKAISHVQEHGVIQSAMDSAHAAVETAKRADTKYLHGTLSKVVDTTIAVAHKGVDVVREQLNDTEVQGTAQGPNVVLTSTTFEKVNSVRSALQGRYGDNVVLRAVSTSSGVAPQPVGFAAGFEGASKRIDSLRAQNALRPHEIVVSIESFIAEIFPDNWMDFAACILYDADNDITVRTVSQGISAPLGFVARARDDTPADYELRASGFSSTVGEAIHKSNASIPASDWQQSACGLSRQAQLHVACVVLLGQYATALRAKARAP